MRLIRILAATALSLFVACASDTPSSASHPRPAAASEAARKITFNGRPATARDLQILAKFEAQWGVQVPSGDYWYDNTSGAAGLWGGPTRGFLGPGLALGGPLTANASGGGNGRLTGVFINGRELHPLDVQGLTKMLGQAPWPGQWWVDGQGNFGAVGQGPIGNLVAAANQRNASTRGGNSYYKSDIQKGSSTFVGSGCAAVTNRLRASESDSSYSYYVGCE
jgi:hypothetical protein